MTPARRGTGGAGLVGLLPAAVATAATGAALLTTQTPLLDVLRYAAYLLLGVLLPGVLVHRALRGRQATLPVDLALGAATGLALELVAWAVLTAAHAQRFLWLWPAAVVLPFLVLPRARPLWAPRPWEGGRHLVAAWLSTAAYLFVLLRVTVIHLAPAALPPRANLYYQDLYWHLALAAELTHEVPPHVPQVAERVLHYHWFADAHLAASSLMSGVALPTVLLRLWLLPVLALVLALVAALTRRVCGAPLPGSWAQLLVAAPAALVSFGWFELPGSDALSPLSPSQVFGLVFLLLALDAGVDVVRGGATAGTWVVLLLALGAAGGSKSSLLPVLLGGAGLALATSCVHRWRNRDRQPGTWTARPPVAGSAGLVLAVSVALALTATTVAGGGAASHLQLLAPLRWLAPWREVTGGPTVAAGGWFVPGLRAPGAAPVALLLVLVLLVQHGWAATSLWLVRRRATRRDPALGLLLGTVAAGGALTMVIDHAAASEFYFLMSAAPVAAVLAAWAAHVAWSGSPVDGRRHRARWLVAGAVAGAAAACGLAAGLGGRPPGPADLAGALALPLGLLLAAVLLAACLAAWLRSRGRRRLAGGVALALTGAVWAGYLTQGVGTSVRQIRTAAPAHGAPARTVTVAETAAARWIARHAPTGDVVATNVHCLQKVTRPGCDARSFWVSGLGEHRVLLEGWGYTDESQAARGRHGLPFQRQPFDDPRLLALNDAAFVAPTAHLMALLRDHHGVRWLLADPAASPLSHRLTQLSRLRFASAGVEVLQLPPASAPLSPPAAQPRPVPSPSRSSRTPSPRPSAGSACGTPRRAPTTKEMSPCAAPASSSSPA